MNKHIYIIIIFVFNLNIGFSQIGGLSASKLSTFCVETVPNKSIEFEPAFTFALSTNYFDKKGNIQNLFLTEDSIQHFSSTGLRFSYGLFKNFEIGVTLPVDISTLSLGVKYSLLTQTKLRFGLMAGYNGVYGNDVYVKRNRMHESTSSYSLGVIFSSKFSDKLSLDFNAQYQNHINKTVNGDGKEVFLSTDIGYYLIDNVNFISGFNYFFRDNDFDGQDAFLFTFNPGIAIEKGDRFILVLNAPIDLFGKNEYKTNGFGLALTILLN